MRNINVNRLLYRTGLRQLHLTWMMQIVQVKGENAVSRPIQISQYWFRILANIWSHQKVHTLDNSAIMHHTADDAQPYGTKASTQIW